MAEIVIDGVRKAFGPVTALESVDLRIADGEFLALLGPSGCGKTTLLRIIAGLETQTSGRVLIGGRDVSALPPRKRGLAMVFQNYAVFPHLTVAGNVGFGLRMAGADKRRIADQVDEGGGAAAYRAPSRPATPPSSGGQRQRVAVARALAVEPAVLLMDEPLSNLDALLRLEMRAELKGVLQAAGTTTVYVTHDQTEAMGLADRIAVLHAGRIVQIDRPTEIYAHPATMFVGGFVGSPPMNFLKLHGGRWRRCGSAGVALPCPGPSGQRGAGRARRGPGPGRCAGRVSVPGAGARADGIAHAADRHGGGPDGPGGGAVGRPRPVRESCTLRPRLIGAELDGCGQRRPPWRRKSHERADGAGQSHPAGQ